MNLKQHLRERASSRFMILAIGSLAASGILFGMGAVYVAAILLILTPIAVGVTSYFWTFTAEWTRLSIAEEYGAIAQKRMEEAARNDLRTTLDQYGVEALDELEAAIARREEARQSGE